MSRKRTARHRQKAAACICFPLSKKQSKVGRLSVGISQVLLLSSPLLSPSSLPLSTNVGNNSPFRWKMPSTFPSHSIFVPNRKLRRYADKKPNPTAAPCLGSSTLISSARPSPSTSLSLSLPLSPPLCVYLFVCPSVYLQANCCSPVFDADEVIDQPLVRQRRRQRGNEIHASARCNEGKRRQKKKTMFGCRR